jgi:hypothetical protein
LLTPLGHPRVARRRNFLRKFSNPHRGLSSTRNAKPRNCGAFCGAGGIDSRCSPRWGFLAWLVVETSCGSFRTHTAGSHPTQKQKPRECGALCGEGGIDSCCSPRWGFLALLVVETSFGSFRTHSADSHPPEMQKPRNCGAFCGEGGIDSRCSPRWGFLAWLVVETSCGSFRTHIVGSHPPPKVKTPLLRGFLRRGWDSNPRYTCAHNGFRDRPIQPLSHLSVSPLMKAFIKVCEYRKPVLIIQGESPVNLRASRGRGAA